MPMPATIQGMPCSTNLPRRRAKRAPSVATTATPRRAASACGRFLAGVDVLPLHGRELVPVQAHDGIRQMPPAPGLEGSCGLKARGYADLLGGDGSCEQGGHGVGLRLGMGAPFEAGRDAPI